MVYSVPEFSKSRVDTAGRSLLTNGIDGIDGSELAVINNWRAAHGQPLVTFNMTLRSRSAKVDSRALVAQRLKRLPSIEAKLRDRESMRLTQMQDIGGVRAVVSGLTNVNALVRQYRDTKMQHTLFGIDDYLEGPKADGYRSVHLIYRYQSDYERNSIYNGLFIEIQIRSRVQHAWATAVETVSLLTGHALKSTLNVRDGEERWRRFLALTSSAFARLEGASQVPNTPTDHSSLLSELRDLTHELGVIDILTSWQDAIRRLPTRNVQGAQVFILSLDPITKTAQAIGFSDIEEAESAYVSYEREAANSGTQTVLVSVDRVNKLRTAYPSFFLDTRYFVALLTTVLSQ
jgi:hypothetical protein